jgi:hypothetical protein
MPDVRLDAWLRPGPCARAGGHVRFRWPRLPGSGGEPAGAPCLAVPRPGQPHRVSLTASAQSVSIRGSFGLYERAIRLTMW